MAKRRFSFNKDRAKKAASGGGGQGSKDFRGFDVGDNYIRILPPWSEEGDVFKAIHQWWLPAPVKGSCYNFEEMGLVETCPINSAWLEARRQLGDDHEFIDNGGSRISYLANALFYTMDRDPDGNPVGDGVGGVPGLKLERSEPFIARISYTVAMMVYEMIADPEQQPCAVDPEQGRIIRVRKPKSFSGQNNYSALVLGAPHSFGSDDAKMDKIWDNLHDLDKKTAATQKSRQRAQSLADKIYTEVLKQQPARRTPSLGPPPQTDASRTVYETVSTPSEDSVPSSGDTDPAPSGATDEPRTAAPGGYGLPKPECFEHHPPSDKCEGGGLEPHANAKTCQLCPWEYHCETASAKAAAS